MKRRPFASVGTLCPTLAQPYLVIDNARFDVRPNRSIGMFAYFRCHYSEGTS